MKNETHADHERVDALLSSVDIATCDGFVRFLSIHQSCFMVMRDLAPCESPAWSSLNEMLHRIDDDLAVLGASESIHVVSDLQNPDQLAMEYVIEGSRLGSKILRSRWLTASDPTVQQATAYFSLASVPGRWRDVCDQLSSIPTESERAQTIVEDTKMLFALFYTAAHEPVTDHLPDVELAS
ncbi:biliverdin-producing heme oxygenase [uncultured Tateyamaria sp.]|uniref:biliverdin-producing heme oxygenase n=1 Tax=uncultured Tateyamaria sp. TaxID=455651 RepID=UPI002620B0D6|nr:biliverdin-producing heme oxygenase [uncultured Tateyamaria sp.]